MLSNCAGRSPQLIADHAHGAPERAALPADRFFSRFARRVGLVTLRQTFVHRCQWRRQSALLGLKDEQSEFFSPEF
jgi:hypothetical protein